MARYELVSGTSSKFWEIELRGSELLVRWGRIGTAGQQKAKPFASPAAATAEQARAVKSKLAEGYREVASAASAKPTRAVAAKPTKAVAAKPAKPTAKPAAGATSAASTLALYDKMIEALEHSGVVKLGKTARPAPVAASRLRAFEVKHGIELPGDFKAFLETHGPLAYAWKFSDGGSYEFADHDFDVGFPADDPFFDGATDPTRRGLVWFAHANGNNTSWGFRCIPGRTTTIVRSYLRDELKDGPATFSELMRDELSYFGMKSEFPKPAKIVRAGEVANFALLADALRHPAPKSAGESALRTLSDHISMKAGEVRIEFRERLAPGVVLPPLPPGTKSVSMSNAPEDLDLRSLARLPKLVRLGIDFRQNSKKTPQALAAFASGLVLSRVESLRLTANVIDAIAIGPAFPALRELDVFAAAWSALPSALAAIRATSIRWDARRLVIPPQVELSSRLRSLRLGARKATRLPVWRGGKALTHLTVEDARLGKLDASQLAGLSALTSLDLAECGLTSLRGLDRLGHLRSLYLDRNKLTELSGIAAIAPRLSTLALGASAPRDVGFVAKLPNRCNLRLSPRIGNKLKAELIATHGKRLAIDWF